MRSVLVILFVLLPVLLKAQIITTIAGNGISGYNHDGIPATNAELQTPSGVAVDSIGNVYIADEQNDRIRKIDIMGIISTIAGNGMSGFSGDGGPATAATFYFTASIAIDRAGNLFIADWYNNRIRKVDALGTINTIAGGGISGYLGDGGPATAATLYSPVGVAVDSSGNVYIADRDNNRVRKVSASGIITTIAGNGFAGYSGDGGPATAAELNNPFGVVVDNIGNVYIADPYNNRIRKVTPLGTISTIAGTGSAGYSGDGRAATNAQLNDPSGITLDKTGNLYIGDESNNRVRKVNTSGIISTVAGDGIAGFSGDGGLAPMCKLYDPWGVAVDNRGYLYIADFSNNRIRKIDTCLAPPIVNIMGPNYICAELPVVLTDSVPGGIWSSSNSAVASIGPITGEVNGIGAGIAIISYSITNMCNTSTVIDTIVVNPYAGAISGVDSICPGDTITLTNTVADGFWISSSPSVATISNLGFVTGLSEGIDTIKYAVIDTCGSDTSTFTIKIFCTTGVKIVANHASYISIYPNPTTTYLNINAQNSINQITITNIAGQSMYSNQYNSPHVQVDVSAFPTGLYFVKVNGGEVSKFAKE